MLMDTLWPKKRLKTVPPLFFLFPDIVSQDLPHP